MTRLAAPMRSAAHRATGDARPAARRPARPSTRNRASSKAAMAPLAGLLPTPQYFHQSRLPWPSLLFVLPLMLLYEGGTRLFAFDPVRHTEVRIVAFNLMQDFFHLFGVSGKAVPALAVVGILLSWHVARRDQWHIRPAMLGKMAGESLILALPVLLLATITARALPLGSPVSSDWIKMLVLSLGAGVYEELVFRLIAFTLLSLLLVDVLKTPRRWSSLLMVVVPALLFALYHYLGQESFAWRSMTFRFLAGIYFGVLFLYRGFGITAGSHAAYDIIIVAVSCGLSRSG